MRLEKDRLGDPAAPLSQDRFTPVYRGRFAPSPTGALHLGSLYTALGSYLSARVHHGLWHLRIDDLDSPRTVPGSVDRILRTLEKLGLFWDGPVLYQSRRLHLYAAALDRLRSERLVYACTCSRKELTAAAGGDRLGLVYPGSCRTRTVSPGEGHALRVLTANQHVEFVDRLQGLTAQDLDRGVGDFIVLRRDGIYAYHLATVLDDHEQGITEVVRGSDLIESTPRQIFLQRLLGLPVPSYAHVPTLVDLRGSKLSKQSHAPEVAATDPTRTLVLLLMLLKQEPPPELATASASEVMGWAIEHWDISRLTGLGRIAVDPESDGHFLHGSSACLPDARPVEIGPGLPRWSE